MEVKIDKLPESKVEILFEIPWEELLPYLDRASSILSKDLKVPGFRPTKIPREIIERELGQDKILTEGAELLIKEKYQEYVVEKRLEVIGSPQVEILKLAPKSPFCFKVKVDVLPEIQLPDYQKIASQVKKKEVQIEDKEIADSLIFLQKSRATLKELKRETKKGDFLEIEYYSPQIEGGRVWQDGFLLGKGNFLPGFEEELEGAKKNEERKVAVNFPKNVTNKELAGKEVNFLVKIKKIQEVKLPEIDDEFARNLGNFPNLKALKESVKKGIGKEKEIREQQKWRNKILEKIRGNSCFETPPVLIDLEKERMLNTLKKEAEKNLKISFSDYLKKIQKTEEEIETSFSKEAERRVKNFLILREIGKREKIVVSQDEVKEAINEFLLKYPDIEIVKKEIDIEKLKEYYRNMLYQEKVMQLLEKASPKGET